MTGRLACVTSRMGMQIKGAPAHVMMTLLSGLVSSDAADLLFTCF